MSDNKLPENYRYSEFEFVRMLGDGGFGITYLGWDHSLDKAVAIKEYFPEDWACRTDSIHIEPMSDRYVDDFNWGKDRFLEEAKTLAKFNHPNLVRAYRYFEANGSGYIVMDYLEGEPLDKVLKRQGTLATKDVRFILERVADGLDSVHQMKFLHRDIKPANVIISAQDNEPILIDFGAARQTVTHKTQALTAIVTAGYGPHEQYSAGGENQGPWTDIYALSALGYKALTGNLPPEGNSRFEFDSFVPLDPATSDDPSLCIAINKGLEVLTKDRPRSAYEWLSLAESKLLETGHEEKSTTRPKTRRRSKIVKPENIKVAKKVPGGKVSVNDQDSAGRRSSAPLFVLVGIAALLSLGGVALILIQTGSFDRVFDGRMANYEPPLKEVTAEESRATQDPKVEGEDAARPAGQVFRDCETCPEMVVIPTGSFLMGSNSSDFGFQESESPQRRISVERKFAIGKYEITVGEWKACLADGGCGGYNPSSAGTDMSRDDYPVSNIPYIGADLYIQWIKAKTGETYRLPSEAEWEYAARGGRSTIYPWGDQADRSLANCMNCEESKLVQVGNFPANDFGLYDVVGSVWEWVSDCKNENYTNAPTTVAARTSGDCSARIIRGGSRQNELNLLRVANRTSLTSSEPRASTHLGFRIYKDLE